MYGVLPVKYPLELEKKDLQVFLTQHDPLARPHVGFRANINKYLGAAQHGLSLHGTHDTRNS